jgi:pilus assembly protein Flp/PilA
MKKEAGRATDAVPPAFRCALYRKPVIHCCRIYEVIMGKLINRFLKEDRGVTAIEYALIAGLIAAAIATTVSSVATGINGLFTKIAGLL